MVLFIFVLITFMLADADSDFDDDHHFDFDIESAQTGDFGNYSCLAMNSLGRSRAHTSITGRPAAPVFTRCLQPRETLSLT